MAKTEQRDNLVSMLAQDPDGTITVIKVPVNEAQAVFAINVARVLDQIGASLGAEPNSDELLGSAVMSLSSVLEGIKSLRPGLYRDARRRFTCAVGVLKGVDETEHEGGLVN